MLAHAGGFGVRLPPAYLVRAAAAAACLDAQCQDRSVDGGERVRR